MWDDRMSQKKEKRKNVSTNWANIRLIYADSRLPFMTKFRNYSVKSNPQITSANKHGVLREHHNLMESNDLWTYLTGQKNSNLSEMLTSDRQHPRINSKAHSSFFYHWIFSPLSLTH